MLDRLRNVRGGPTVNNALVRLLGRNRLRAHWYIGVPNFGDQLSPEILHHVAGREPVWVSNIFQGKVLALGSIAASARPGDVVWGAGALKDQPLDGRGVRYLAVRGPLTRATIRGDVPEVYGDPAMLLPEMYQPTPCARRHAIGVVPHYVDRAAMTSDDPAVKVIDVRRPWREVVDHIVGCDLILSSSLHGVVIAEAYGIPAVWVEATGQVSGGGFKFRDYYLSTGREPPDPQPWGRGLAELTELEVTPFTFDLRPLLAAASPLRASLSH